MHVRIVLLDVKPEVWRRLVIPTSLTMGELARVFIVAMGWDDVHLHGFRVRDEVYGIEDEDAPDEQRDEDSWTVAEALELCDRFYFDYDFGDGWVHEIEVESRSLAMQEGAECVAGENACPPDDIGGPAGFRRFLEAIGDPDDAEHDRYLWSMEGTFDPTRFDLFEVNAELGQVH